ncbi:MAG: hypothetical protein ACJ8ER_04680 [Allosphingosinicella sp.]
MSPLIKLSGLAAMLAITGTAQAAAGWQFQPAQGDRGTVLTFEADGPVTYRFQCAGDSVMVTETGVTALMDLQSGQPVDSSQAALPAGAAVMALFDGRGDPQFVPADAVKNPAGGWDLTIRLRKDDKLLKAIGKSETISLFTTGYTMAVPLNNSSRILWRQFLASCKP